MFRVRELLALLVAVLVLARVATGDDRVADTRRFLELITGARIAYSEAFEDGEEELVAPVDLAEARILLQEARNLNDHLRLVPADTLAQIARDLESPVGGFQIPMQLNALAAEVSARTGIVPETRPPAPPSSTRGRDLYRDNCAGCHGARGAGDGADAKQAGLTPADFTRTAFMRRETPLDFFTRITLGHRGRGMPGWSALTVQERWDLVAYAWTLAQSDADRAAGTSLWAARCASCHGATGQGVSGVARSLPAGPGLSERTDRALFVELSRGPHVAAIAGLSDAQRWQLAAHARALSLGGVLRPERSPARPESTDRHGERHGDAGVRARKTGSPAAVR